MVHSKAEVQGQEGDQSVQHVQGIQHQAPRLHNNCRNSKLSDGR